MQSMFRPERRSLSVAPPGGLGTAPSPTGRSSSGIGARLRAQVRPTFLVAAIAIGAACLIAVLLVVGQASAAGGEPAELPAASEISGPSTGVLLAKLPWGSDRGMVGRSIPEQGLARGPEAIAVAPDGHIFVLDSVNRRVAMLSAQGEWLDAYTVPLSEPRFLNVTPQVIAVVDPDADRAAVTLDWSGLVVEKTELPRTDAPVTGVFLADDCTWVETGHARCIGLGKRAPAPREGRPVTGRGSTLWARASHRPGADPQLSVWTAPGNGKSATGSARGALGPDQAGMQIRLRAAGQVDHLVSLDGDAEGHVWVGARLIGGGILVTRLSSPDSLEEQSVLLPEPTGLYLGVPYVVSPDGRIVRAQADDDGYSLWVYTFDRPADTRKEGGR